MPVQPCADPNRDIIRAVRESTSDSIQNLVVNVDELEVRIGGDAKTYYVKQLVTL